ncbi:MAG: drug/metabolite transporter (DMT)-like permease [Cycloclasticus pugetii]|jgi:drug/metabolite transporter (DMT)-like permease|uniref:Permease, drug/metabolite transporter superfamily protein n=2 Tax=Cycloclasticus pugetii TaxID=34068 RepID=A0AB33Z446_9GAMM|nr:MULTISPECIES: DMT family transporter [Cycloclasticus]ATI03654.1 DMT family transporter [Cycloclasticus sp. PY97N]EPD14145.1 permease, drug/metabolite transporter superfamily protein [Cycloclasticus pugetii]MBV1898491.1 DMT family transporter [Cycloclasticus sp.]PHR51937.1 MAG: EamA/RhaT family transporter [Cycloclasticus sp.]SHI99104.1 Permease of the drug/metabolite transporter (DMT) superfamily [Cycloclasticus pugetii]|tara:strand:+ start:1028 stop:1933 length:906 start_codon:yes stop_codon:yes gene_type:complete
MDKETIKALLYLNVASILWGGNVFFGSYLKDFLGPWSIMSVRMLIGSFIFLFLLHQAGHLKGVTRLLGWKEVFLIALSGTVAYQATVYFGLRYTTAINVGLINSLAPIAVAFAAAFYLKEKLGRQHWIAAFVSVIGLVFILSKGSMESLYALRFNKGDLFILGSIFIWAVYSIAAKLAMAKVTPLVVTALGILLSTFIVIPLGVYEANYLIKPVINAEVIMAVVFIGIGPTVLSLLFWNKGVMIIGPARASLFLNMVPIYVIVLSSLLLDEVLHDYQLIGMVLIIGGSLYANRQKVVSKKD